jgi:tetratricopeptide (TPR) repeat protein
MNKQFDQAIEMESAAITNSSPDTYSLRIRAEAYLSEDDYEPAIQDLDAVLKLAPSLEEGYQLRGKGEFGLKEYGASVTDEDAALKLNPKDKKAQTILQQAQAAE